MRYAYDIRYNPKYCKMGLKFTCLTCCLGNPSKATSADAAAGNAGPTDDTQPASWLQALVVRGV